MCKRFIDGASDRCSGCTACVAICPREAIVMCPPEVVTVHVGATTMNEVDAMCGSKYVQSDLGTTLQQCKDDLESGREMLLSGFSDYLFSIRRDCRMCA